MSGRFAELEGALVERVAELRSGGSLTPLTIVVGSAAVGGRVGDLLVRRLTALANVKVVTLARLAADLVTQARQAPPAPLTGFARERLVRRLVAARSGVGFAYFGSVSGRPHFARALAATFADLRQARVDPAVDWAVLASGERAGKPAPAGVPATPALAKAADLQCLYAAYCEELRCRGLADDAGLFVEAALAVRAGAAVIGSASAATGVLSPESRPQVTGAAVAAPEAASILYGIYDLNAVQEALLVELLTAGADLFVPVPRSSAGEGAVALVAARSAGLVERRLEAPPVTSDRDRLAALWQSPSPSTFEPLVFIGDGSLAVVSVADQRSEAREATRAVLAAAAAGAAVWDCAVVVPHSGEVERLATALGAAGLPVACRCPERSVGSRLLLRLCDCLAPEAGAPFARRAVVDLIHAAPLRDSQATPREMALWLDESRRAGVINGVDEWNERIGRRRRGLGCRLSELQGEPANVHAEPDSLVPDDDEERERLELLRLRLAAVSGLEAAVETLTRACAGLPDRAGWDVWAAALSDVAAAVFAAPAAAAVSDVAGRLQALSVLDEEVERKDVAAALREQLAAATVPEGRIGRDGVAVLTPLELRGLRFHTVVFTGLAEDGFPVRGRADPLCGDGERRRLGEALGTRLPLAESRDAESLVLFALACEAAREQLTLLAPRSDVATGRPRLPSRLLLRLASLAAGHPVGLDEYLSGIPLAPVWRHVSGGPVYSDGVATIWLDAEERDSAALLALSERGGGAAKRDYLAAVLADPAATLRRLGQWQAARDLQPGAWDGLLGEAARAALQARHPFTAEMHPTRLERYIGCPFAFLLRDVIGLEAPEEPDESLEMDGRELGILVHEILQRVYTAVMTNNLDLDATLREVTAAWQVCCAEAEQRGVTGAPFSWNVRRAMLLQDLHECVRRDPMFGDGGHPVGVEWRFGEAAKRPVSLTVAAGRQVRFAGRLDRVDRTVRGARIIDYKTGKGDTEQKRLKKQLGVQLPVYQLAVRQNGGDEYDEVACLYRFVTRRGGFRDLPLSEDEATAGSRLSDLVSAVVNLVDGGVFARSPAAGCEFCDVAYACGVSAWTRARKRGHEALQSLVSLQALGSTEEGGDVDV
ncbi:MAG: PD-(D/E)XK nuclease family protein [Thermoleophilia bacterium]